MLELGHYGPDARPAFPALLDALTSDDAGFRARALALVKGLGPADAEDVPKLTAVLRFRAHRAGRLYALEALEGLRPLASDALLAMFQITMGEETEKAAEQTLMNAGKPQRGRGRKRR